MAADNDLALAHRRGGVALAYWRSTVIFVLEDDAQSGPDHVDSTVAHSGDLALGPGRRHPPVRQHDRRAKTMEELLHWNRCRVRPLTPRAACVLRDRPDLTPYTVIGRDYDLAEVNPDTGKQARLRLDQSGRGRCDR